MYQPNTSLINTVTSAFSAQFNYAAQKLIQAPGRVNLIGEHTDYNDGFVLPCAINYHTVAAAAKRDDNIIRAVAVDYDNQIDTFDLTQEIKSHPKYQWANYIRGVIKYLSLRGYEFGGADLVVSGNVPQGAGLSSSASLEVAIGQTFKTLYDLRITPQEIALTGQQAENQFVGCNCGIMDQLISAEGEQSRALLIDCRSLKTISVPLPDSTSIVIINSNVKRELVGSEYNIRREQCESAAEIFGVKALRDISIDTFEARQSELTPLIAKRARHVITENYRTRQAALALSQQNVETLGTLMAESHISMRDDFEITIEPIDYLVDLIKPIIGEAGGVRMTGGGFGGCVVALVPSDLVDSVKQAVSDNYEKHSGIKETMYVCKPSSGASEIL